MRKKLIELLGDIQQNGNDFKDVEIHGVRIPDTVSNEEVTDHLIANGVTLKSECEACGKAASDTIIGLQETIKELRAAQ